MLGSVGRQQHVRAVRHLPTLSIAALAVWALVGCGGSDSGLVTVEGDDEQVQDQEIDGDSSSTEGKVVTVVTEVISPQPEAQSDGAESASGASSGAATGAIARQVQSTGPVLQWTEFNPGFEGRHLLVSTGDGRVVIGGTTSAGERRFMITADGSHWEALQLPDAVVPQSLDVTGARWAVAGRPDDSLTDLAPTPQLFLSDDEGSNWSEVTLQIDTPDLPPFATASSNVTAVATAGPHVLALVSSFVFLDLKALLLDRGLISAGTGASSILIEGDELGVTLHDWSWVDESDPGRSPQGPEAELIFTIDELDLSAEQRSILGGSRRQDGIRVFSGVGPELVEAEVTDGWRARAFGTDDGFVLLVQTDDGVSLMRSTDGKDWSARELDPSLIGGRVSNTALEPDGTAWLISTGNMGRQLTQWKDGAASAESVLLGRFDGFSEFSVGHAGLAVTALPSRREESAGEGSDPGFPTGRVAKDGYELRYGEPEGGITLWDLAADESVYVFGPDVVSGVGQPEGVREVDDGDTFSLTFEDPDTGQDLVTFTYEDLAAVIGEFPDAESMTNPSPWVGWSSDGTSWGWQSTEEAFGLGEVDARIEQAVGEDFVIAVVWGFGAPEQSSADIVEESADSVASGPRWFIAPAQ